MSADRPSDAQMRDANVNPETGLATDYLNLFNEATMLFELALDMPGMAQELHGWKRKTYVEHFEHSGFARRDVVIAAYYAAPSETRARFDGLCEQVCDSFSEAISGFVASDLDDGTSVHEARETLDELKHLVSLLDAEIHGRMPTLAEGRLDGGSDIDQAAIDALF